LIVYFSSTSPDWAADVGLDELLALAWVISHREPLSTTLGAASTEEQLDTDEDLLCLALSVVITIAENNVGAERLTRLGTTGLDVTDLRNRQTFRGRTCVDACTVR